MVDVLRPDDSTDPLQLSEDRNLPRPPSAVNQPQRNVEEEIPVLPTQVPTIPVEEPIPQRTLEESVAAGEVQILPPESPAPVGVRQFQAPRYNHPNLRYPTVNPLLAPGVQVGDLIGEILSDQSSQLNSIRFADNVIERTQNLNNLRSNYGNFNETVRELRQRYSIDENVPNRHARNTASNITAIGAGIAGVSAFTRNVMAGQPFHPLTRDAIDNPNLVRSGPFGRLVERFTDREIEGPIDILGTAAANVFAGGGSVLQLSRLVGDAIKFRFAQQQRQMREDGIVSYLEDINQRRVDVARGLTADAVGAFGFAVSPTLLPGGPQVKQFFDNLSAGIRGFQPIDNTEDGPNALAEFYEQSPAFRQILESLDPIRDDNGEAIFNPLTGNFGDFGSAGALSGLLWLANIPEGTLTGGLYELANLVRDGHSRIVNNGQSANINPNITQRPGLLSGLLGRDVGIMNRYSEDSYLSFVGNPALEFIPRKGQWYLGFLADAALGGIADAPIDALFAARRAARPAIETAQAAVDINPTAVIRSVSENPNLPIAQMPLEVFNQNVNRMVRGHVVDPNSIQGQIEATLRQGMELPSGGQLATLDVPPLSAADINQGFPGRPLEFESQLSQLENLVNLSNDPASLANYAQSQINLLQAARNLQRQLGQDYQRYVSAIIGQAQSRGNITVTRGVIEGTDGRLDDLIPPVNINELAPTFPRYSLAPQMYRANPGIPPSSLDFVRRTDEQLINLAKRYGIEDPDDVFISNLRLASLAEDHPELLSPWGRPLSDNINSPLIRISNDADPILALPPSSSVVDTPPVVTIDAPTLEVIDGGGQTTGAAGRSVLRSLDDEGDETLESTFRRFDAFVEERPYLNETEEVVDLTSARRVRDTVDEVLQPVTRIQNRVEGVADLESRRVFKRVQTLQQQFNDTLPTDANAAKLRKIAYETQRLLEQHPEVVRQIQVENLPPALRPRSPEARRRIDAVLDVQQSALREAEIASDLRNQLDEIDNTVRQQEAILQREAPLERTPVISESIARASEGDTSLMDSSMRRSVPDDVVDLADFPALHAREVGDELTPRQEQLLQQYDADFNSYNPSTVEVDAATNSIYRNYDYSEDIITLEDFRRDFSQLNRAQQDKLIATVLRQNEEIQPGYIQEVASLPEGTLRAAIPEQNQFMYGLIIDEDAIFRQVDESLANIGRQTEEISEQARQARGIAEGSVVPFRQTAESVVGRSFIESIPVALTRQGAEFGDARYISDVVDEAVARTGRNAEEIQNALIAAHRRGEITLSRADMASAMDQTKIAASAIGFENAEFHLIKLRNVPEDFTLEALIDSGVPSMQTAQFYHGTKGRLSSVSAPSTTSLTNELGIGTYLSTDRVLAQQYARAMPAKDSIDIGIRHTRPTELGRVYPVTIKDEVTDFLGRQTRPTRIVDVDAERDTWRNLIRSTLLDPDIDRRFRNWSSPGKNQQGRNFLHYIRSQFIKKHGKDGYAQPYSEFLQNLQSSVLDQGIDGLKYGDTTNIINNDVLNIGRAVEDIAAEGSVNEALLSRYAVDTRMHTDLNNSTTRSILEDDRLDLDVRIQQNLENAVGEQEARALDEMRQLNQLEADAMAENLRTLRNEPDEILKRKMEEVIPQNRNIIRNQGDDCL